MSATRIFAVVLLLASISACPASAQVIWCSPALHRPLGVAPDACGPGWYIPNYLGAVYGPNYFLRPCFPPEQGIGPGYNNCYSGKAPPYWQGPPAYVGRGLPNPCYLPQMPNVHPNPATAAFPTHPYARSPRDFFMWGDAMEDELSRLRHPALIP
jgi:hypothetical protein